MKSRNALLIKEPYNHVPIRVIDVIHADIFPVKFEYKKRGYRGIVFSERLNRIKYEN